MASNVITTPAEKVWLDDGIIRSKVMPGAHLDLAAAKASSQAYAKFAAGKKHPLLVDARGINFFMAREARAYYSGPEANRFISAVAVLVSSASGRMIMNFLMGLNKPITPTKLFESETQAIEWLKGFLLP